MIWKDVEQNPNYEINRYGKVRNKTNGNLMHGTLNNSGYETVSIGHNKHKFTHRLVAEAFVNNPDPEHFKDVNHKDGNKRNNNYKNLEWTSRSENVKHAYRLGLNRPSGGGNGKNRVCCEETGRCYISQQACVDDIGGSIAALSHYLVHGRKNGLYRKQYHVYKEE